MAQPFDLTRRTLLPATAFLAAGTAGAAAQTRSKSDAAPAAAFGLVADPATDQSQLLQAAIDQTAARGATLVLPAGKIISGGVKLRRGSHLIGAAGGATVLSLSGTAGILTGTEAHGARIEDVTFDGASLPMDARRATGLVTVEASLDVALVGVTVRNAKLNGIVLRAVSGRIQNCLISGIGGAAVFSTDAAGLDISHNTISDCADNGILIWRSRHGEDATMLTANRIQRIRNVSGGTGQYGNGINIYRAARVLAANNMISDCAYTAIRANEASDVQMLGNSVQRIGEVALYTEAADVRSGAAGFEGAVITSNMIDEAATGIVVTNFNNGGRLAVIQGNLVRNLKRREQEAVDKRGEGIAVEADAVVANNVIENAPTCGIMIGWSRYMREVVASGNLIRKSRIGIAVTGDAGAGQCLLANNMISEARDGAIRAMDHARAIGADLMSAKAPRHIVLSSNTAI